MTRTETAASLSILETEQAILLIKREFQDRLAEALNLYRVSSPLFISGDSGFQDNLNGTEKPVDFSIKTIEGSRYEIVHSLAKWKRWALARYNIPAGKGLYTDMNALRPDEDTLKTGLHSVYVDQWDWEKHITAEERTLDTLKETVRTIYKTFYTTAETVKEELGIDHDLPEEITFIHTEELIRLYPDKTPKEREDAVCREHKAVFLIGIGGELPDGTIHDGRAPDYDDWTTETEEGRRGLNGDILLWNAIMDRAFEISSMGIRVDGPALEKQLKIRDAEDRKELAWHKSLLNGELPLSVGGGIGQSRLCMFLLQKRHIGEVQVSIWPDEVKKECAEKGIALL